MSDALVFMISALDQEIAAVRKNGGSTQIELKGGELIGRSADDWLYRFALSEDLNLRDDTPVRVRVEQEEISGILVSFREGVLVVALDKDVGPTIASARLIADDTFLLERLKERLQKVQNGEAQFCRPAADRVLGLLPVAIKDAAPHKSVLTSKALNDAQARAVKRSLGSDTLFLWGPPGTGKTTTLACIVEAHYRAGRSVLLVSNTNIAVDTALERIAERLQGEPAFNEGLVLRLGPVVKEELRHRFGSQLILSEIVARLSESLRQEKAVLECEQATLQKEEEELKHAVRDLDRLDFVRSTLTTHEKTIEKTKKEFLARQAEAKHHSARAEQARTKLERAQKMSAIRRFFSGLNPERLAQEIASAEQNAEHTTQAAKILSQDLQKLEADIISLQEEVRLLTIKTKSYPSVDKLRSHLAATASRLNQIRQRLSAIEQELAEIERQVIARCRILATTAYRTYLGKSPLRSFDVAVVDEASMLMPPLVFYTAGLAAQAVTIAGDFRQLPPIVVSKEPLAEEWLKRDIFEKAGIPDRLSKGESPAHLMVLDTQYRMREPICAVINELFYADHPLKSHPSVSYKDSKFPLGSAPLLYLDTSSFHPWVSLRTGTFSRYNLFHALLVRNIVLHLAETGFLPVAGEPNDAVGVVSPYAAQARLTQALLNERLGDRATGIAATVHRFQGNEKRAMILDLTDSIGAWLGRFLQATRLQEDGARLLNVAASRARDHMILVGNFEYLRAKPPREGLVRRLLDHFEEHGEALDLATLLPLAERDWIDGLHQVLPATFDLSEGAAGVFTEGTFYPAFSQDLLRARQSIVILSPFATETGTSRWADIFRDVLVKGVRVRILTRPLGAFGGEDTKQVQEVIDTLRRMGVTVDLRERMHEKIAIVDGRILWHGSLNILSHRDTSESMLRIESPAACQQLEQFLSTPASGRQNDTRPSLVAPENPPCPECGGITVWNRGRHGIWFACEDADCDGKVDARRHSKSHRRGSAESQSRRARSSRMTSQQNQPCPEPGCCGTLHQRKGRFGFFLGCSEYPRCRYTEELD